MKLSTLSIPLLLLVALGCGGGGGGSSSNSPGEPAGAEFAFGTLSGRAASTNPPKTTNSPYVTATSLTGIITSLRLRDQQLGPEEGRVVFGMLNPDGGKFDVYACNVDGTDLIQITNTPGISEEATTVSPDGKKIAFHAVGPGGDLEIYMMNIDGTGRVQLTDNDLFDSYPRWAPTGTSLTYGANDEIYMVNINTKVVTRLTNDAVFDAYPDFAANGQRVVFHSAQRNGTAESRLWSISTSGGAITPYYSEPNDNAFVPRVSRDGFKTVFRTSERHRIYTYGGPAVDGPTGVPQQMIDFTPDSKRLIYSHVTDTKRSLILANLDGSNPIDILADLNTFKAHPSFVPAPSEVTFVGGASIFGSRLAGFVFSQQGPSIRALLGFDANTPLSAVVIEQTGQNSNGPNLVYSIDADVVTDISYAHGPYWKPIKVVGGGTPIGNSTGALVSIDSVSGKIVAVLPFTGSRAAGASFVDEGGTRVFTGEFLGVFDSSGKNLGAASEVRLDVKSGDLSVGR